jgi:hypothetical protein
MSNSFLLAHRFYSSIMDIMKDFCRSTEELTRDYYNDLCDFFVLIFILLIQEIIPLAILYEY